MTDLSQPAADIHTEAQPEATPASVAPPLWLLAELTYRCPLHCAFCYNPVDYTNHNRELSTEQWLGVLREARARRRAIGLFRRRTADARRPRSAGRRKRASSASIRI